MGNAFSHGKNMRKINDDAAQDALAKSEEAIRAAPQLLNFAHQ